MRALPEQPSSAGYRDAAITRKTNLRQSRSGGFSTSSAGYRLIYLKSAEADAARPSGLPA